MSGNRCTECYGTGLLFTEVGTATVVRHECPRCSGAGAEP